MCYLSVISLTVLDHLIGIRLEAPQNYYVLVLWMLPSRIGGERIARTSFKKDSLCCDMSYTRAIVFKPILLFGKHTVVFVAEFPYVRLGLPVETVLDPCWRIVSEGLLGGMDTHG